MRLYPEVQRRRRRSIADVVPLGRVAFLVPAALVPHHLFQPARVRDAGSLTRCDGLAALEDAGLRA